MNKFAGLRLRNLTGNTGLVRLGLMVLIGLVAGAASAQTNFASAQVLTGNWGSVLFTNTTFLNNTGPNNAGFYPNAPVWYQWTAPADGVVALDTIGSVDTNAGAPLDTVLAVYTGTSLAALSQVAANDDIYNKYPYQFENLTGQNIYLTNYANTTHWPNPAAILPVASTTYLAYFLQPLSGPSGLRFNAVGGTTYYFVVDTKVGLLYESDGSPSLIGSQPSGRVCLNWAYHPSGVFRFATEDVDLTGITNKNGMPMLLYTCAETEGQTPVGEFGNIDAQTVTHTYYDYNCPGVLVTVTRVAGSSGRVSVNYKTIDGPNINPSGDVAAKSGLDYTPVSGTLIFDDFEMSKTILIPIKWDGGVARPNRLFTVILTNAMYCTNEYGQTDDVPPPRVDSTFGKALVRILDVDIDPKGESSFFLTVTNPIGSTNIANVSTNLVFTPIPTNVVLNFQKAHYRVAREVTNYWGGTPVTVYVNRSGTNTTSATATWRINNYFLELQAGYDQQNQLFPLQPGSDYAMPDPPNANGLVMGVTPPDSPEYTNSSGNFGTLNWGDNDFQPKAIHFTVYDNGLTTFNKDFSLQLYIPDAKNPNTADQLGMVAETTVTIMFDDQHPPAGSVDEFYNADFNTGMALSSSNIPPTTPVNNPHPGTDGEVSGLAVLANNETVVVGDFFSYNGNGRNCMALITTNGMLDNTFLNGLSGANDFINAVALTVSGKFIIGGNFTSFNGAGCGYVARLNANGSLNTSFLNGLAGADNTVWAVLVQPDGKVLIGGDFTHVNGTVRNHLARLNTDGSLDSSFDPGTNFSGSVYALALQPSGGGQIFAGGSFGVGGQGYINVALLNGDGTLNTSFSPGTGPDNSVFAVCWQPNGQLLLGGAFNHINGSSFNGIARLNTDGSIDTTGFFPGTGADSAVNCIIYCTNVISSVTVSNPPGNGTPVTNTVASTNYGIYVGGSFTSFNGTHRLGFARLYTDGTVDTTFLNTAYNQFAGLPRIFLSDPVGSVYACGVQSDGNVMIGGSFNAVGGGQADKNVRNTVDAGRGIAQSFADANLWVSKDQLNLEPKARDGIRNRNNVARLIGGSINGATSLTSPVNAYAPGNIGLLYSSYSANESQSSRSVELTRANGGLGPAGVNFALQPGLAQSGVDYNYTAVDPFYWITWEYTTLVTRMHSHGLFGTNGIMEDIYQRAIFSGVNAIADPAAVQVSVYSDPAIRGNLNAQFQLANPSGADQFYLGGQNIPMGVALGRSSAPFTLIDDRKQSGQFGFTATNYLATNAIAVISVVRSNGAYGQVSLTYSTSNGTAVAGTDYVATNNTMIFRSPIVSNAFNVKILNNGYIYTNFQEKTINLHLSSLSGPVDGGAIYGISNAVLRLINPNFQGYLSFNATNFTGNESAGFISFVVNRVSGSYGNISVQYATTNGTAFNPVDYTGTTNSLSWTNGDVSPRIVSIPIANSHSVSTNKYFKVFLFNPTNGVNAAPSLFYGATTPGSITNATLTINNDNSYGTLQFSAPTYLVNENGNYATITVIRTGGAAGSVSVTFATTNGPNAYSGTNYTGVTNTLTFATNQIAVSVNVQMLDDGVRDPANFYFGVTLSNPTNAVLGSPSNAIVNIVDAEPFIRPSGSPGTGTNSIAGVNGEVLALALQSNGQILVGGNFSEVSSVPRNYAARLNTDGSLDTTFLNNLPGADGANGPVNAIVSQTNGRTLVGGAFNSIDDATLNNVARLMTDGSLDTSFNPGSGADGAVYALAETFIGGVREIYVGGAFNHINGASILRPGIARLNDDGTVDGSFTTGSGADGTVYAVAVYPTNSIYAGKMLIGGAFTHYNGTNLNHIARLNVDGSVDTTFNPGSAANDVVNAIAIQLDGRVLVGGSFFQFNGTNLNRLARLNADGSLDTNFVANIGDGVNNTVKGIAVQADNRILVAGLFTQVNGLSCNRIVRLLPSGALDTTINFGNGASDAVDAAVVQPGDAMIIIGGAFTQFNGQPYDHLVRLYGGSMAGYSVIVPAGSLLISESGPVNHIIDPGETVMLSFAFRNIAGTDATNLAATLLPGNGVTPLSPSTQTNNGILVVGGPSVSMSFSFIASGTNGQSIVATFQLSSGTNSLGTAIFTYMLGTVTNTFANTNLIVINDHTIATPYPSTINVSGVGGTLLKATVTFSNLTHTYPADIDALLGSPYQQGVLLMANAGASYSVRNVTLMFDDFVTNSLPATNQIVSGTYNPTAYFPVSLFPAPAPPLPNAGNNHLSILNGSNPNGTWSLFVIDDTPINIGAISNGWSLTLVTASPIAFLPPTGTFQLSFTVPTNSATVIQATTNLAPPANWIDLITNTPPYTSPFTYTDLNASSYPDRFYRAVPAP